MVFKADSRLVHFSFGMKQQSEKSGGTRSMLNGKYEDRMIPNWWREKKQKNMWPNRK